MNETEQRIAIAEACGWIKNYDWSRSDGIGILPDFLNDLNAMHEAEKVLSRSQMFTYIVKLGNLCPEEPQMFHATAAQRAEAFLRTLNLWKDEN